MMMFQTGEVRLTVDKDFTDEPGDALSGRYRQLCTWTAQQCQRAAEAIKKSVVAQVGSRCQS